MPRSIADVLTSLERIAPFGNAADWDPVGLQIGDPTGQADPVAVCHEITETVLDRILSIRPGLVVTYHPLIFHPLRTLTAGPGVSGRALRLAEAGVGVVAMHTNFDVASGGTADSLAGALGLADVVPFGVVDDAGNDQAGDDVSGGEAMIGRVGRRPSGPLGELVDHVERVLGARARVAGEAGLRVGRIAVIPGSGSQFVGAAVSAGCEVLVTGDISHHRAREANERGLAVIDAGHAPTERPGVKALYAFVESIVAEAVDLTGIDDDPWEAG